jgi:hypothetical protein
VGLTGVIYALVVLAWAAYLLPQALRRHDEAVRKHSIERFSSAMRVLARRGTSRSDGGFVAPARTVDRVLTPSLAAGGSTSKPAVERPRPSRAALKAAAARRRRVLVVLVSVTLLVAIGSVLALVPWWSVLVPLVMIIAFLTVARRQVHRASESYWEEVADQAVEPTNVVARPAVRVDASHGATRDERGSSDDEPTVTLNRGAMNVAAADLVASRVDVGVVTTADGASLWDPLPVTLPTYVDKSVAKRTYRTVELGEPGTWSSGHSEQDTTTASAAGREDEEPATGSEAAETPRAVNG